ncbi:MAG: SRPBCC family protein [Parvularculaceae bacterium]|nr:SRPBCC family protein [Parvularculaceae bacterium]
MNPYGERINENTVRFERLLPGPIERVWDYIVDPEKRKRWFCAGDFDLRPGGKAEFHFDHRRLTDEKPPKDFAQYGGENSLEGTVIEADAPHLLVFDWPDPTGADTRVTIELEPAGDRVRLTLTHENLCSRDALIQTSSGWHGHLDLLDAVLTTISVPGFWSVFEKLLGDYAKRFK